MANRKRNAEVLTDGEPTTETTGTVAPEAIANGQAPAAQRESKADKFRRLGNRRVPNAVKRLKHVGNMFNRAQYDWTPEQGAKILKILDDVMEDIRTKISGSAVILDEQWTL